MHNYHPYHTLPSSVLVSKCLALEELLSRKCNIEAENYDLISKYKILEEKYNKLDKKYQLLIFESETVY